MPPSRRRRASSWRRSIGDRRERARRSRLGDLLGSREGHYVFESGLHGSLWLHLEQLFSRPGRIAPLAAQLAARLDADRPDIVCGPLVGGALLAQMVAVSAELRFAYSERTAWTPGVAWSARYELPRPVEHLVRGHRVAVVDDAVNAGSALRATVDAVRRAGGDVVTCGALLRLGDTVEPYLAEQGLVLHALAVRDNTLWPATQCPLCARGVPLDV
jgi:orotate phosphoribosyltransferase